MKLVICIQKMIKLKQEKRLGIIISGRRGHNYLDFSKKLDHAYLSELLNQDL